MWNLDLTQYREIFIIFITNLDSLKNNRISFPKEYKLTYVYKLFIQS